MSRLKSGMDHAGQIGFSGWRLAISRDVLRRIAAQDDSWETMVPAEVADLIKRCAFFGFVMPAQDEE